MPCRAVALSTVLAAALGAAALLLTTPPADPARASARPGRALRGELSGGRRRMIDGPGAGPSGVASFTKKAQPT